MNVRERQSKRPESETLASYATNDGQLLLLRVLSKLFPKAARRPRISHIQNFFASTENSYQTLQYKREKVEDLLRILDGKFCKQGCRDSKQYRGKGPPRPALSM